MPSGIDVAVACDYYPLPFGNFGSIGFVRAVEHEFYLALQASPLALLRIEYEITLGADTLSKTMLRAISSAVVMRKAGCALRRGDKTLVIGELVGVFGFESPVDSIDRVG